MDLRTYTSPVLSDIRSCLHRQGCCASYSRCIRLPTAIWPGGPAAKADVPFNTVGCVDACVSKKILRPCPVPPLWGVYTASTTGAP
jgi:hypothetical protein